MSLLGFFIIWFILAGTAYSQMNRHERSSRRATITAWGLGLAGAIIAKLLEYAF
jgi:hypothetical protein